MINCIFPVFLSVLLFFSPKIGAHDLQQEDDSCSCTDEALQFAPVPESALGVNVSASEIGYVTESLGDGAYVVYSGTHQALFLVTGDGVIVVDNPASLAINMQYAIGNVTDEPVRKFVYSHSHNDHVGGAGIFDRGEGEVEFIAHEETDALLRAVPHNSNSSFTRPMPSTTFQNSTNISLGNQTVKLDYYGSNHQPGNIFISTSSPKILMLIDIIYPGWVPFLDLALADFLPGYVAAHDIALSYDFDTFIGGHYGRTGDRADVETAREYISDLLDSCRGVLRNAASLVDISLVIEQNPENIIARGRASTEQLASLCAAPVQEKWIGRLAGVDTAVLSHATRVIFGLRIEYGEFP